MVGPSLGATVSAWETLDNILADQRAPSFTILKDVFVHLYQFFDTDFRNLILTYIFSLKSALFMGYFFGIEIAFHIVVHANF